VKEPFLTTPSQVKKKFPPQKKQSVTELETNDLWKSTLTDETLPKQYRETKTCLSCGFSDTSTSPGAYRQFKTGVTVQTICRTR
jgi:hypothetical protein